jgi:MFS family permease
MHQSPASKSNIKFVITSSSIGTLIEWYDFYIFGMLASIISKQFFPEDSGTAALLSTLAIFAAGFIVRPFGALVFGRLGDLVGRKYTFLLTLVLMGGSTFCIGLVPSFSSIGWAAPILVLLLRLIQGLALGGEYGGAATYIAEHSPANQRGFFTSFIQTTATIGLFIALGVILLVRNWQGIDAFNAPWGGWRYPFWVSLLLVIVSVFIRLKMHESPMFSKAKATGNVSKNPLKESFNNKANFKMVLLALFGAVMGQGVIWYTGQFYAQSFLENVVKLNFDQSRTIMLWAIFWATPFFIFFGWLSDKIGRKWIMLGGMLLGIICYIPIFKTFVKDTNIKQWEKADHVQLSKKVEGKKYKNDSLIITTSQFQTAEHHSYFVTTTDTLVHQSTPMATFIKADTNPTYLKTINHETYIKFIVLIFVMILFVTMAYGPIAAFLVELFPTKIRYTSMSLPYHIGNGVFGGLVPFLSTLIVEYSKTDELPNGNPIAGLYYPIIVASICFVIGAIYLPSNKKNESID